jgi:hypothetical protein
VDGLAASMASIVCMAGDEIEMPSNAFMMLHNPSDVALGDAEEMRKSAALLDQVKQQLAAIYAAKSGKSIADVGKLMDAETWLDGATALAEGFATKCLDPLATAASIDTSRLAGYRNTPATLKGAASPQPQPGAKPMADETTPKPATLKELKAACPGADEKFLCAQLEAEATVAAAQNAWMTAQSEKISALEKAAKEAPPTGKKPGVAAPSAAKKGKKAKKDEEPVDETEDEDVEDKVCDDDMEDLSADEIKGLFETAVANKIKGRVKLGRAPDRRGAIMAVANEQPKLHQAYLVACNGTKMGRRLIEEKYDQMPKPRT